MGLITIKEFAKLHNVDPSAISHAIKKERISAIVKYGKKLISETALYSPHSRGRKAKVKRSTKK